MKNINEERTLTTIHLSDTQKAVMTKIIAAATPETALEDISDGRNLVANRDILVKLGLIEITDRDATVTEEGKEVMRDENLIDATDQLTPDGQQYVGAEQPQDLANKDAEGMADPEEAPADEFDIAGDTGEKPAAGEDDLSFESKLPLITSINRALFESEALKKLKRAD